MKVLFLLIAFTYVRTQDTDDHTDENRPYKFAFTIEGYQHRSEEKDEKGIIKGEYGFVTGDGVYHETVYATDENGNFKIISMKNYYIGLPGEGTTSPPVVTKSQPQPTVTPKPTTQTTLPHTTKKLSGIPGCSGCLIPSTTKQTTRATPPTIVTTPQADDDSFDDIDVRLGDGQNRPPVNPNENFINNKPTSQIKPNPPQEIKPQFPQSISKPEINQLKIPGTPKVQSSTKIPDVQKQKTSSGPKKSENDNELTSSDPSGLLYEFNQTQTFQGHSEKGFTDNSKVGEYFVSGRDGLKQIIEYKANEDGFQPRIRFVDLTPSETPDPETEKMKNMLKTMFFKWYYGR